MPRRLAGAGGRERAGKRGTAAEALAESEREPQSSARRPRKIAGRDRDGVAEAEAKRPAGVRLGDADSASVRRLGERAGPDRIAGSAVSEAAPRRRTMPGKKALVRRLRTGRPLAEADPRGGAEAPRAGTDQLEESDGSAQRALAVERQASDGYPPVADVTRPPPRSRTGSPMIARPAGRTRGAFAPRAC